MDFELTIQTLAAGGWGVGRHEGKVIFVPLTAPGDVIRCAVTQDRERFAFGTLVALVSPSPARVTPPCEVFGRCGGCQWQHIGYEEQLAAKHRILSDALSRIGRIADAAVAPAVGSPQPYGWRAAVDLAFRVDGNDVRVGFYSRFGSDIVPIESCPVACGHINARIARLAGAIAAARIGKAGEIRLVAGIGDRVSANLILKRSATESRRQAELLCTEAGLSGLEVTTPRGAWSVGGPVVTYPGWDGAGQVGLFCRPSGFVQANPDVNRELVDRLISIDIAGKDVLDLFCGIGNLTVGMATAGARVTGVEASDTSVQDARRSAETLGLSDVRFVVGKADAVLAERSIREAHYGLIVLDPPRTGARAVMEMISDRTGAEIVYISCWPPTLARDLAAAAEKGWRLVSAVPMDMFPQTFHVEALCRLKRG